MPVQEAATTVADDGKTEMDTETTLPRARISGAPTLELVAAESGVSRSTVSRVVNGSPKVRPEVVEAVNAAIERLNYVPNRAARSLASRQTYAIALLVPERVMTFFNDPFFASVVQGITEPAWRTATTSSTCWSPAPTPPARPGAICGAATSTAPSSISHHAADRDLADLCDIMPVVFGGRPALADLASCHYVDIDNVHGARTAVEHLVGSGRRRIATITGPGDMLAAVDRRSGWLEGLQAAGLPADALAVGDFTELGGAAAMRDAARRLARPGRRVRGQRPDGAGRPAGAGRSRPVRSPATSRWSATTTARPPRPCSRSCPPWPSRRS